jgi:mannose-6-phosphate isomerase
MELMAASDNVVRAGFTPKFKDVETLVSMLEYKPGKPQVQTLKPRPQILISMLEYKPGKPQVQTLKPTLEPQDPNQTPELN